MKLLLIIALTLAQSPFTYGYMPSDCVLYGDAACSEPITTLPATYFVIVLEEKESDVFKVSYKDVTGYIKGIEITDYEPVTKFASARFTVNNDGYPVKLRSTPVGDARTLVEIPSGKSGYYYGDATGSALIPQVGDVWRYVSYNDGTATYNGYVYSSQVDVEPIVPNVIEKVVYNESEGSPSPIENTDFLLIACLCVPSVLIMYLIFRDKDRKPRYKE